MRRLNIAAFLRKSRENAEISQVQVAQHLGVAPAHVCDVEAGRRSVALSRLPKLLTFLGVSKEDAARVYQAYGELPPATQQAYLAVPELWDVDPTLLLTLYKETIGEGRDNAKAAHRAGGPVPQKQPSAGVGRRTRGDSRLSKK